MHTQEDPDLEVHKRFIAIVLNGIDLEAMPADERWHFERRLGLGGSEVSAILGVNQYKTPHQVWLEKTGRSEPQDLSNVECVHFGHVLEDVVAKEYVRRTGNKVARRNRPFVHASQPWLRANLDRVVIGQRRVLECKTAGAWAAKDSWGTSGTDEVPESYLLQVTHYMNVLGWDKADLAVLIGGNEFRIYHFDLNHELNEFVQQKLRDFWINNVIADVPPDFINTDEINRFYAKDNGSEVRASNEVIAALDEYKSALEVKKEAEKILKDNELVIKSYMQNNQILVGNDGKKLVTWKTQIANRFDSTSFKKAYPELATEYTKASSSRVFRI